MAFPSVTYTFANSTTADATQVNQNFTDLINGLSDGTKALSISSLTIATNVAITGTITSGTWNGTKIAEIYGGTNQSLYTLGDLLYASAANTLSKLSGNTAATTKYMTQVGTGAVSAAPAWSTLDNTYTPTTTNNTNAAAVAPTSASAWLYFRIGNMVHVVGHIDIDPTLAGPTITRVYISIPVGANFSSINQACGNGGCEAIAGTQNQAGIIYADSGSQRVIYDFSAVDPANHTHGVNFMYQVQ